MSSKLLVEIIAAYSFAYGQLDGAVETAVAQAARRPWDAAEVLAKLAAVRAEVSASLDAWAAEVEGL